MKSVVLTSLGLICLAAAVVWLRSARYRLRFMRGIEGLDDVHDLHVWTLTSGFVALSGHGVIDSPADHMRVLDEIRERMSEHGIGHVTFQLELRTLVQLEGVPS